MMTVTRRTQIRWQDSSLKFNGQTQPLWDKMMTVTRRTQIRWQDSSLKFNGQTQTRWDKTMTLQGITLTICRPICKTRRKVVDCGRASAVAFAVLRETKLR